MIYNLWPGFAKMFLKIFKSSELTFPFTPNLSALLMAECSSLSGGVMLTPLFPLEVFTFLDERGLRALFRAVCNSSSSSSS